ncbi:murein L,D-transpeptidase family protein [Bacteroidota bacterium]
MIPKIITVSLFFLLTSFISNSFKDDQLRYPRVRQAYKDKEASMNALFESNSIDKKKLRIYLRAFKEEKKIELWAKSSTDQKYKLIKEYKVCRTSGKIGPKRKQGDRQIPEGFYRINRFNPHSNFYLSLGINYPNKSDKILGEKNNLGGDIFIHGSCVTIGCLPITDNQIKELYIICVEAKNSGQSTIPVTIFPMELSESNFNKLKIKYSEDLDKIGLWIDLKKGYDIFNQTKELPNIGFLSTGKHTVVQ